MVKTKRWPILLVTNDWAYDKAPFMAAMTAIDAARLPNKANGHDCMNGSRKVNDGGKDFCSRM